VEEMFVRRVRVIGKVLGISLPHDVIKKLQLKAGDYVKVKIQKVQG